MSRFKLLEVEECNEAKRSLESRIRQSCKQDKAESLQITDEEKKTSVSSIPTWDGANATCPRYIAKIEAWAVCQQCADALEATEMANCATKAAHNAINKATEAVKPKETAPPVQAERKTGCDHNL